MLTVPRAAHNHHLKAPHEAEQSGASGSEAFFGCEAQVCCVRRCCSHPRTSARRGSEGVAADAGDAAPPTAPPVCGVNLPSRLQTWSTLVFLSKPSADASSVCFQDCGERRLPCSSAMPRRVRMVPLWCVLCGTACRGVCFSIQPTVGF